ncbi:transglutaminase-like domain-containing protein [Neorhodopirellula pilleata]|uniref:Transglutaminase-like superfamily protein n=1 Tax=Neorhodopirellula pilleata TaxID=2714738 RepID=A0A5C6A2V8_9BACT|nr:transglutaminase-like domain-containing protein [Neorhodopirellula pilleata]TWT93531.1 Transglutaminase-like superfamily protein [Neorhodopirellula pilleata]
MPTWSRRRIETIALAALAIASVIPLRFFVESRFWFLAEMGTIVAALLVAEVAKTFGDRTRLPKRVASLATSVLAISPIAFAFAARAFGSPIAYEMSALTLFGAASLAMAVGATTNRTRSLSLVVSGFLVLFCASISDSPYAAAVPLVWMLGCVWHLIANHWERLDLAMPASVQRSWSLRPSVMIMTLVVLAVGGYAIQDRMKDPTHLKFGWMPTSGGSEWSDPAARSGVGTGDAAIAAKDHAESFGAVDSDIFLESTESTLFDMFNDMIGEPKKQKNKWEKRQGMNNENVIPMHERAAKSEQGGGSFSTQRMPPKKHRHFQDKNDASVVQWDGPTGIRLAMQRYDTFDGDQWSQSADLNVEKLTRVDINDAPWFFDPAMRDVLSRDGEAVSVGLLKIIRLDSQRLPVPMMTAGVHIKEVDRQDFYGITGDGSFFMPGRDKVPPLTVVHVASVGLMEDEIREGLRGTNLQTEPAGSAVGSREATGEPAASAVGSRETIGELVESAIIGHTNPVDQLNACIEKLRTDFTYDRDGESSASSLEDFWRSRRGGDHLFATTAALMARQIGLSSRLVTGFYVRPDSFDMAAGHASVLPQDVHVWAEVRLDDGRWFEIEPTPGFMPPVYRPSWRLLAVRFAAAYWPVMTAGVVVSICVYLTRCFWIDWLLSAVWALARWLRPRQRVRLAIRIIEARARLAGQRRPTGKSQRAWLEQLTRADAEIARAARRFSDAADELFFGHGKEPSNRDATALVDLLHVRTINALTKEAMS